MLWTARTHALTFARTHAHAHTRVRARAHTHTHTHTHTQAVLHEMAKQHEDKNAWDRAAVSNSPALEQY